MRGANPRNRSSMRRKWDSAADAGTDKSIFYMRCCKSLTFLKECDSSLMLLEQKHLLTSNQPVRRRERFFKLSSRGDMFFDGNKVCSQSCYKPSNIGMTFKKCLQRDERWSGTNLTFQYEKGCVYSSRG